MEGLLTGVYIINSNSEWTITPLKSRVYIRRPVFWNFQSGNPFSIHPMHAQGGPLKIAAIYKIFYLNSRTIYSGVFKGRLLRTSIGYSRVRNVHFEEHVDHSGLDLD